jgi:hypothetical protein
MAAINNNNASVISYGELIVNFGVAYAAAQELVRSQQSQMQLMQQYCMALQQQPPPTIFMLSLLTQLFTSVSSHFSLLLIYTSKLIVTALFG